MMNHSIILSLAILLNLIFLVDIAAQDNKTIRNGKGFCCKIEHTYSPIYHTPLFVLDGTPTDSATIQKLNREEIQSIQILKDPAAAALYGPRGGNGVVIIITKQELENNRKSRRQFEKSASLKVSASSSPSDKKRVNLMFYQLPSLQNAIKIKILDASKNVVCIKEIAKPYSALNYSNSYTFNIEEPLVTGVYTLIAEQGKCKSQTELKIK